MNNTQEWGATIISQLISQGVSHFCLSPGSRSTALTLALAKEKTAKVFIHYDERGMAFYALGVAKATKKPVVLIVTSGTAVGNLLPAVMEAYHTHLPLVIITADRPPELRETGANQTTNQVGIFSNFVKWEVDLPCPGPEIPEGYLKTTLAHAIENSLKGPVHLNCMLRKPFVTDPNQKNPQTTPQALIQGETHLPFHLIESWGHQLSEYKKGVIVVGPHQGPSLPIYKLAKKLDWPLIADLGSSIRELGKPLPNYNLLIEEGITSPDAVLHFGGPIISAKVSDWIKKAAPSFYAHISEQKDRVDQSHIVTHRIRCDPFLFCQQISKEICLKNPSSWNLEWSERSTEIDKKNRSFLEKTGPITELGIAHTLNYCLDDKTALFIGNSMPIRDADSLLFPKKAVGPIFSNRGLSGIDGNIATAIGIANGIKKRTLVLIGDTTFLHDLNSLGALKESRFPIIIIVINNQGGGIFSFLPIAKETPHCEKYFGCPHPYQFERAAQMFGINYQRPTSLEELQATLATQSSSIIELQTNRTKNFEEHREWIHTVINRKKELL